MEYLKSTDSIWLLGAAVFFLILYLVIVLIWVDRRLKRSLKTQTAQFLTIVKYQQRIREYEERVSIRLTVGGGEFVYGNHEAIKRIQKLFIDSKT